MKKIAIGTPRFQSRFHRRRRYRQIEEAQRSLVRLQLPHHSRSLLRRRLDHDVIEIHCKPAIRKGPPRLGEYFVPAGSTIFVSPYIIHHNQRYYTVPERFLPERFGEGLARRGSSYSYIPFGAGAYAEVEHEFALSVGKLILAQAAQRFELTLAAPINPALAPYPQGLELHIEQRTRIAA